MPPPDLLSLNAAGFTSFQPPQIALSNLGNTDLLRTVLVFSPVTEESYMLPQLTVGIDAPHAPRGDPTFSSHNPPS